MPAEDQRAGHETPRSLLVNVGLVIGLATTLGGGWFSTYVKERDEDQLQAQKLAEMQASQALMQTNILRELDRLNARLDRFEDRQK